MRAKQVHSCLADTNVAWICDLCDSSNFSRSFRLSISIIKPRNYFTLLSNQLGLPAAHFSQIASRESFNSEVKSLSNLPLTILTANVNHLLSKRLELKQFIMDNDIDILIACETKINNSLLDSELVLDDLSPR